MAVTRKRAALALGGAAAIAALSIALSVGSSPSFAQSDASVTKVAPTGAATRGSAIERGRYIATAADCVACHTAPDGQPFAGGLELKTPFGSLVSSNITADRDSGIGSWTEQDFEAALRHGKAPEGHLYPAMPYTAYTKMSDADVADLWAYMRTVKPVSHKVVADQLPFPLDMRWLVTFWNLLFFHEGRFQPNTAQTAQVNRGAYLSEALEHCGTCHTPKNLLGSDKSSQALQGGTLQNWNAPDLTNNPHTGLANWSEADIATYLRNGTNRITAASGPMSEAIVNSTQHLTDADIGALAAFLKALPARPVDVPAVLPASDEQMANGKRVFATNCTACHTSSGRGVPGMMPSLAGNAAIRARDPASLLNAILKGTQGPLTLHNPAAAGMPRFDWKLSDDQIADAVTYIRNSWGNSASAVTTKQVAKMRKALSGQDQLALAR